jgi:type VI secretion system secreted protein Hcp
MAVDYFLKIDGIEGESQDDKHRGEIDVLSFSLGETNDGSALKKTAGALTMQDFHFVTPLSRASPPLFLAVATGTHFKEAILTGRQSGENQLEFVKWIMSDMIVTSYQEGGSGSSDTVPFDQISLNFAKIEFEYKYVKADGTVETVRAGWDLKANKPV